MGHLFASMLPSVVLSTLWLDLLLPSFGRNVGAPPGAISAPHLHESSLAAASSLSPPLVAIPLLVLPL